jgi:membrane protein implicated in regulation of membrane protease activity
MNRDPELPSQQETSLRRGLRKIGALILAGVAIAFAVTVVIPFLLIAALITAGIGLLVFSVIAIFAYVKFRRFRNAYFGPEEQEDRRGQGRSGKQVHSKVRDARSGRETP